MFSKKQKAIKFNLTAEEFLTDLIPLLNDIVLKIKQKNIDDYDSGRVFAYDVLSIIQMQAKKF